MSKAWRYWVIAAGVAISGLCLVKYFSETEMRRLDKEVDRLCAIDGDGTMVSDGTSLKLWMDLGNPGATITYRYEVPTKTLKVVGDAWLVLDREGNGLIDSGRELFGVDTLLSGDSQRRCRGSAMRRRTNPFCHADSNRPPGRSTAAQHIRSWV